jgi:hypothetical protein
MPLSLKATPTRRADRPGALRLWSIGAVLIGVVSLAAYALDRNQSTLHVIPSYSSWFSSIHQRVGPWLQWVIGDTTEAEFYKSALGGIGMLAGGCIAHVLWRRRSRVAGFAISYGTGLFVWLLLAAWSSLLLSNLVWGWSITPTTWQPTFVPFVSVAPSVVLVYGRGLRIAATASILGALLTTPVSILVVHYFCIPLSLPSVIGNVTGMWVGALIAFAVCRRLPWMRIPAVEAPSSADAEPAAPPPPFQGPVWVVRRVLADFTEAQFYGNELASAGLILGTLLEFQLNPASPVYGTLLLPGILTAQVITATLAVLLYRKQWATAGWYPTFVPVVSVAPAVVLTFGVSPLTVVVGAVIGALAAPPIAAWISRRLPSDFHPFIGNVMSMTVCVLILIPVLKAIPGFHTT